MAVVVAAPPVLSPDLALFHTIDPLLANSPVLVFYGPAVTIGATSSRIQIHVFTAAGVGSYVRLAVSPNSPFYSAVSNLPREEQGDEVCRGLAFGLKRYFAELSDGVKKAWCAQVKAPAPAALFGDDHVAILASRMTRIENVKEVIEVVMQAFGEQRQIWQDMDVVLPPGTIKGPLEQQDCDDVDNLSEVDLLNNRYGKYAELVRSLGETAFLPTSRVKRNPSKVTTVGRSASFLKQQKVNTRKQLCELLSTEESYVLRVQELDRVSRVLGIDLSFTARQQLREVFPESIDSILGVNSQLLQELKDIIGGVEQIATQDITDTPEFGTTTSQSHADMETDLQGVLAVAKCLCDWLPQLAEPYGRYLSSHATAAQNLRTIFRGVDMTLVAHLQEIGEQKLTSLLIEPVQRLPRYTLYIDGIVRQLPHHHPAIKHLLKARDLVTEICSQDSVTCSTDQIIEKLRSRVLEWPTDIQINGRLVTAADFVELPPPFTLATPDGRSGILLLFTDSLILLEKNTTYKTTARGLLADLESVSALPDSGPRGSNQDLYFVRRVQLATVECTESHGGSVLQILTRFELDKNAAPAQEPIIDSCRSLKLEASYEGKATRLLEEIVKARVEGRFSEPERETHKWEVRCTDPLADHVTLFSAVFDDCDVEHVQSRRSCASIRVVIDIDRHAQKPRAGQNGIRSVVTASPLRDGLWRLTIESLDGSVSQDQVSVHEILSTLDKRLATLASTRHALEHPSMTSCLLDRNLETLQSLDLQTESDVQVSGLESVPHERVRRPKSPVKLLANFLSGAAPGNHPSTLKKDLPLVPPPLAPRILPPGQLPPKPPSRESRPVSRDEPELRPLSLMRPLDVLGYTHKRAEDTLATYLLALQARKGNIVGRSLKMRSCADELAVNELYNSVLADPSMMVYAAQATVDVLFAAFEKFLNIAWKEHFGPILPFSVLQDIQSKAETMFPGPFSEYFRSKITTLSPGNQRAFKGMMTLLADLLDGTSNDGDRGMLTAAFAEVLVTEANPHEFIALIDRFVDDTETYFGEPLESVQQPMGGPTNASQRTRSVNSSSLSSNASSLRKKFGFSTLSRENSKTEQESKVSSIIRSLSKSTRNEDSPAASTPKHALYRSHSTESEARIPSRPSSQDGLKPKSKSALLETSVTPATLIQNPGLSTIGEHPSFIPTGPPRKKRRSSLSDLKLLDAAQKLQPYSPPSSRTPLSRASDGRSLPASTLPSTPSSKGGSGRFGSPVRETPRSRLPPSFREEASPSPTKALTYEQTEIGRKSSPQKASEVIITARPTSGIPSLVPKPSSPTKLPSASIPRTGLAERPGAGNIVKTPSSLHGKTSLRATTSSILPRKPRVQSPQKLRERLQEEQVAISTAQISLQDQLKQIGNELIESPSRPHPHTRTVKNDPYNSTRVHPHTNPAQRVLEIETQLPQQFDYLTSRVDEIRADLMSSLTVSETKCRKLDDLYREANSENEALYTRFNDELSRVVKVIRGGDGVEELKCKLKDSQDEGIALRRELQRLKRENAGLRAQLRD
nr:hypothetical protein CFP56_12050 [Quercus suber]